MDQIWPCSNSCKISLDGVWSKVLTDLECQDPLLSGKWCLKRIQTYIGVKLLIRIWQVSEKRDSQNS